MSQANKVIEDNFQIIKTCISDFNLESFTAYKPSELGVNGDDSNLIYLNGCSEIPNGIAVTFMGNSKNSRVYIGEKTLCRNTKIQMYGNDGVAYVGNFCKLINVNISVVESGDAVFVGNGVTTTSSNLWTTGFNSNTNKSIIIGDDCMFSFGITICATDGHPIYDIDSMEIVNSPSKPIVIEPHCWIGQNVCITKNVSIGACSIVAAGAVVTKSCERFSMLSGVPATARSVAGKIWSRDVSARFKEQAKSWGEKFKPI